MLSVCEGPTGLRLMHESSTLRTRLPVGAPPGSRVPSGSILIEAGPLTLGELLGGDVAARPSPSGPPAVEPIATDHADPPA